jgi:hypothetical protein
MLNLGLSASERTTYHRDLAVPHPMSLTVLITDNEENPISGNVAPMILEGQIDGQAVKIDRWGTKFAEFDDPCILHTLTMRLFDPGYQLRFDSSNPGDAALYLDRMVKVTRSDYSPTLGRWINCPMFLGPVSEMSRENDIVTVTAQSKESLASHQWNQTKSIGAAQVTDIIKVLLTQTGEGNSRLAIPDLPARSSATLTLLREARLFVKAYWLAEGISAHLYYDANGFARLANSSASVFEFNGSNILEFPSRTYGTEELINTVRVVVGDGTGKKNKFDVTATLPDDHPNSSKSLQRNFVRQYRMLTIQDDQIPTLYQANVRARTELQQRLNTVAGTEFAALCVPDLELWDVVTVKFEGKVSVDQVTAFSKPLTADGVMSVGHTRLVARPRGGGRR